MLSVVRCPFQTRCSATTEYGPRTTDILLFQHHLLPLFHPADQLGLDAVGDSQLHGELLLAGFRAGSRRFHKGVAVLVVDHRRFGELQHVWLLLLDDLAASTSEIRS